MHRDGIPAITISLRDLPRHLIITSDGEGTVTVDSSAESFLSQMSLKGFSAGLGFMDVAGTRSIDFARSDANVTMVIGDTKIVNFGTGNAATEMLAPGKYEVTAYLRGSGGDKGFAQVEGRPKINLEIAQDNHIEVGFDEFTV